ncbi:hypothetical protein MZD04_gp068 [Pseudomonas phage Psa21]|uniref:Uncharacterized protein n=1 Tax=Pseudomonas phage Psa21 TaxID=2530023 RepID=A0A481W5Q1_9CAUD|nr:hypothetical protein MZD04_gp068 [Pseudomonas phage Psa21]QBJ02597.1 hypothetical protein PSA21_68 [Pseudomonas phage Psa21]
MDIIERDVGQIPVSIGTSLAFEGLLGIHPNQPVQPTNVKTIQTVWVNLRTLARNLFQAVPTDKALELDYTNSVAVLLNETQVLPVALSQKGFTGKVRYYLASKDAVKWSFPKANFKELKSPKQIAFDMFERFVSIELYQQMKELKMDVMEIDMKPKSGEGIVAIMTHYPHELLWKPQFSRLLLLESHTGKLKTYNTWYTKLNGISENEYPMPFTEFTLQVFGDGELIAPQQPRSILKELKELSKAKKWTGITTPDKLYHDIMGSSKELKDLYKLLRK